MAKFPMLSDDLPNPWDVTPTPLDQFIHEREEKEKANDLAKAHKEIKELKERANAADKLIADLTAHINNVIAPAIHKLQQEK